MSRLGFLACYIWYMKNISLFLRSFLSAAGTFVYIFGVAWGMSHAERIFGPEENLLIPLFMLLLFVISAATTGFLVLGKPILLYWDGAKKQALILLFATLGWLFAFLCVVAAGLILI